MHFFKGNYLRILRQFCCWDNSFMFCRLLVIYFVPVICSNYFYFITKSFQFLYFIFILFFYDFYHFLFRSYYFMFFVPLSGFINKFKTVLFFFVFDCVLINKNRITYCLNNGHTIPHDTDGNVSVLCV